MRRVRRARAAHTRAGTQVLLSSVKGVGPVGIKTLVDALGSELEDVLNRGDVHAIAKARASEPRRHRVTTAHSPPPHPHPCASSRSGGSGASRPHG